MPSPNTKSLIECADPLDLHLLSRLVHRKGFCCKQPARPALGSAVSEPIAALGVVSASRPRVRAAAPKQAAENPPVATRGGVIAAGIAVGQAGRLINLDPHLRRNVSR